MQVLDDIYHRQYQQDSVAPKVIAAFDEIAEVLVCVFDPKTAMDVGSGGGALVQGLLKRGVDAYGIDGSSHCREHLLERIRIHDLREPLNTYGDRYDLVTCTDVGEHIEEEFHSVFCETLAALCRNQGTLVFGAAPEGQDGLGHVSCRHPVYWIGRLLNVGFKLRPFITEELRRAIQDCDTNHVWWVTKNMMVFEKVGS